MSHNISFGSAEIPNSQEGEEVMITVPWGHIAGKTWNSPNNAPVLLLHGLFDNAGSFDALVPLLPKTFHYVAIDLPGHGKSSPFPPGLPVKLCDFVLAVERVADFWNWQEFTYIGHSVAVLVGFFYCAIFPNRVKKIIALEAFLLSFNDKQSAEMLVNIYSDMKRVEKLTESDNLPRYSYEDAIQRIVDSRGLSSKSARMLAKRCLVKAGDGYRFSTDPRLKLIDFSVLNIQQCLPLLKRIRCPVLRLIASESNDEANVKNEMGPIDQVLLRTLHDWYRCYVVEGGHHVHLNFPERVSGLMGRFLTGTESRL